MCLMEIILLCGDRGGIKNQDGDMHVAIQMKKPQNVLEKEDLKLLFRKK